MSSVHVPLEVLSLPSTGAQGGGGGATAAAVVPCSAPDFGPLLFKQFKPDAGLQDPDVLADLVRWRRGLPEADRALVDARTAWPLALVVDAAQGDDAVVGTLFRPADQHYLMVRPFGVEPRRLFDIARDKTTADRLTREHFSVPQRMVRLSTLISTVRWLHDRGVVVGDLNPNNAFTTAPAGPPEVFVIDCDSFVLEGRSAWPRMEPDDWAAPVDRPHDVDTDLYKLALTTVRCLQERLSAKSLDEEVLRSFTRGRDRDLLERALRLAPLDGDSAAWDGLASTWRVLVTPRAQFVSNDVAARTLYDPQRHEPAARELPAPAPKRAPSPKPVPATVPAPAQVDVVDARSWARRHAVLLVLLLLLGVAAFTLTYALRS